MAKRPKMYFRKLERGLLMPCDDRARQYVGKLKTGTVVGGQITQARNLGHHRKFMALVRFVSQHWPWSVEPPPIVTVMDWIKFATGHVRMSIREDGTAVPIPESIAFESMDQVEFSEFYDEAVEQVNKRLLPELDSVELREAILEFAGQ